MADERRAHPRHGVEVNVQFRKDGTQAVTHDLSLGGCAIVAPRLRLVNEKLWIGLSHPKTREELDVVGEVKRAVSLPDGKFLLGVQFIELDDALHAKLVTFIESSVPAAKAAAAPTDEASRLVSEATGEEHSGNVPQAIRLLEKAIGLAPKRADILATRARLAQQTGDMKGAANWAKRAAEVDPSNTTYAQLYQRFSLKDGGGASGSVMPPVPAAEPQPGPRAPRPFVPNDPRGRVLLLAGGLAMLALAGGNLWYWVLRHAASGPSGLDPEPFRDVVPMRTLLVRDGRAYGTVDAGWAVLPDREKRLADLAGKLRSKGVSSVYLSDSSSKLVATYKDGTARLFN